MIAAASSVSQCASAYRMPQARTVPAALTPTNVSTCRLCRRKRSHNQEVKKDSEYRTSGTTYFLPQPRSLTTPAWRKASPRALTVCIHQIFATMVHSSQSDCCRAAASAPHRRQAERLPYSSGLLFGLVLYKRLPLVHAIFAIKQTASLRTRGGGCPRSQQLLTLSGDGTVACRSGCPWHRARSRQWQVPVLRRALHRCHHHRRS